MIDTNLVNTVLTAFVISIITNQTIRKYFVLKSSNNTRLVLMMQLCKDYSGETLIYYIMGRNT